MCELITNRTQKGSRDPIQQYNRFGVLDADDEEESMVTDHIPPSQTKNASISKKHPNRK
jgi:hypothetical protein